MAVPTNTRETYGAIGIREDLSNIIYNISTYIFYITVISILIYTSNT